MTIVTTKIIGTASECGCPCVNDCKEYFRLDFTIPPLYMGSENVHPSRQPMTFSYYQSGQLETDGYYIQTTGGPDTPALWRDWADGFTSEIEQYNVVDPITGSVQWIKTGEISSNPPKYSGRITVTLDDGCVYVDNNATVELSIAGGCTFKAEFQ